MFAKIQTVTILILFLPLCMDFSQIFDTRNAVAAVFEWGFNQT